MSGTVEPKNRYKIHDGKLYSQAQLEVHYQHSTSEDNVSYQHKIISCDNVIVNVNGQEESGQQPGLVDERGNVSEIKQDAKDLLNEYPVGAVSFSNRMDPVPQSSLQNSDIGLSYPGAPRLVYNKSNSSTVHVATEELNSNAPADYPEGSCTFSTQNVLVHEINNTQALWYGHFYRIYYFFSWICTDPHVFMYKCTIFYI